MKAIILLLVLSITRAYPQSLDDMVKASIKKSNERIDQYEESRKAEAKANGTTYINVRDIDQVKKHKIDSVLKVDIDIIKYDIDKFLVLLNEYRASYNLSPVKIDSVLMLTTAHHAKYLKDGHHFYPDNKVDILNGHGHYESYPDGRSIDETFCSMNRANYYKYSHNSSSVMECTHASGKELLWLSGEIYSHALSSWKKSKGHNAILLRPEIKYIGVAATYDPITNMVFVIFDCGN